MSGPVGPSGPVAAPARPSDEAASRVLLTVDAARALSHAALVGIGYDPTESALVTAHLIDAALCGYEYSGLPKILNLAEYRAVRPPPGPMRRLHETPLSTLYDGGGQNGMITIDRATDEVIAKAAAAGFAVVGVNHTWMSGRGAYYVERIARAGLVAIHTVSSRPQVAPPGAAAPAIGTNPLAFGFPTAGDPLLIDLGTSAVMFTDLALRARRREPLPPDVAIDVDGRPTQDPERALAGAALSFGGHKGFALALAAEALGVLAGSEGEGGDGVGYLLIAMRPDLLMPLEVYRAGLTDRLDRIRAVRRRPGTASIRLPSQQSLALRERNRAGGLWIDEVVREALLALAGGTAAC